jgi:hypothetical protein
MARKLDLRTVKMTGVNGAEPGELSYGEMMCLILKLPPRGGSLTLDEIITALDAIKPIEAALKDGAETVTLSDTQWATLRDKLAAFPFAFAVPEIAEFGLAIRNAPELT